MQFVIFRTSNTHPISFCFYRCFILFCLLGQPKSRNSLCTKEWPPTWDNTPTPVSQVMALQTCATIPHPTMLLYKDNCFSFSPIRDRTRTGVNSVVQHIPSNRKALGLIPDMGRKTLHLWTSTDFWLKT